MSSKLIPACVAASLGFCITVPALAATNLVVDGNFTETTNGAGNTSGLGEFIPSGGTNKDPALSVTAITGWNAPISGSNQDAPFLFVVNTATLDTTGFKDSWDKANRQLWGSANGGLDKITASPDGSNVLLMDADYNITPIYQELDTSDLTVGDKYTVSFYWAAGEWQQNTGATTEGIEVGLGGTVLQAAYINAQGVNRISTPSKGFSGWYQFSDTFTYEGDNTTLTYAKDEGGDTFTAMPNWLTIIAEGSPQGEPPTVLLSGVSLVKAAADTPVTPAPGPTTPLPSPVPEPGGWAMMIVGVGALGLVARRRRAAVMSLARA
jgi:hypothetical protein